MKKLHSIAVIAVFFAILLIFSLMTVFTPDHEISMIERRTLQKFPGVSVKNIFSEKLPGEMEKYLSDHFAFRNSFRTVQMFSHLYLFGHLDNHGIYFADGSVSKLEYTIKEKQLLLFCDKLNSLYTQYLSGMNVYYSVIPDKNYYIAEKNGYLFMDYKRVTALLGENIRNISYIDIFDCLDINSYYTTDMHWKQTALEPVLKKLGAAMGFTGRLPSFSSYERHTLSPFYGAYCAQSALLTPPDEIVYLTSHTTESVTVYNLELDAGEPVYTLEEFEGPDAYSIFLSGSAAFQIAENPFAQTEKELIIFRDSFGSSLVPLMLDAYAKITVIDLRYILSAMLTNLIEFKDQDVLFLYSMPVINNASMLR